MTVIRLSKARNAAIDRIIYVMRQRYSTELTAAGDGVLELPAPTDDSYYADDPDLVEDNISNHPVVVFVWPAGPRQVLKESTRGPQDIKVTTMFPVDVVIAFRPELHEPYTKDGRTYSESEYMRERAEKYLEALIECIFKYAPEQNDGASISMVEIERDEPLPLFLEDRIVLGLATATFKITQTTLAPTPRPL